MNTPAIHGLFSVATQVDPTSSESGDGVLSLEQRLLQTASNAFVNQGQEKSSLQAMMNNPHNLSDPGALVELQARTAHYEVSTMLVSSLTHKAVDTVSTLLKAS